MICYDMEDTIFKDLQTIPWEGVTVSREDLRRAVDTGLKYPGYSHIIAILCKKIRLFTKVEQDVAEMRDVSDANGFVMDLSSFLNELECPYEELVSAPLEERLATSKNRLLALDFLIGELQAAILNYKKYGAEKQEAALSPAAEDLKKIIFSLGLTAPPADMDAASLFDRLETKLKEFLASIPPDQLGEPLLKQSLSKEQWEKLEHINNAMCAEYRLRREMLLKRFDVTVQSFSWSERAKLKEVELKAAYAPRKKEMSLDSKVTMADVLAARSDLLLIEKTSSSSVRKYTHSPINRVIMGDVPDRGGRTTDGFPLGSSAMPSFRPREQNGGDRGGRGGGRVQHFARGGGGRGSRGAHAFQQHAQGDRW